MTWRVATGRLLRVAEIVALIALSSFLFYAAALMKQAREDEQALATSTGKLVDKGTATLTDARRVILSIGGTATEVRKTTITARAAANEQRVLVRKMSEEGIKSLEDGDTAVRSFNDFLLATNRNVNEALLPQATATLETFDAAGETLEENFSALKKTNDNLALATEGLAGMANNPDIPKMLADGRAILDNGKKMSDEAAVRWHQMMKPGNLAWHIFSTLLRPAGDAAQIYSVAH